MLALTTPNPQAGQAVQKAARLDLGLCWTCGSCDFECPVNIATNRLQPRKLVRLANLGFVDELLSLPEIWYCLSCRRCNRICPMQVQPADLIAYARSRALTSGAVSREAALQYRDLYARFQRIRWSLVDICRNGQDATQLEADWQQRLQTPTAAENGPVRHRPEADIAAAFNAAAAEANVSACYTCGECVSACPVSFERSTFDPMWIVRMAKFGLQEELLQTSNIWLCIGCRRCSDACPQRVSGHLLIERLQELAAVNGVVPVDFKYQVAAAAKRMYHHFLDDIDRLLQAA
jgi:heterodisulfide reductase subunit C